jgi:hypothetical protein
MLSAVHFQLRLNIEVLPLMTEALIFKTTDYIQQDIAKIRMRGKSLSAAGRSWAAHRSTVEKQTAHHIGRRIALTAAQLAASLILLAG